MKKNKMMRVASILLVAVLLTTSVISGTFAKYVTSGEAEDEARVAKFGVVIAVDGDLFATTYITDDDEAGEDDIDGVSVKSSDSSNVVAPGTANEDGLTISVTGTPEVDVRVEFEFGEDDEDIFLAENENLPDMTTSDDEDTFDNEDDYYPIVYTLTKDGSEVESGTLEEIKEYIAENYAGYYNAGDDLEEEIGELNLTWAWAFNDGTKDEQDTLLGDLAADDIELAPETDLTDGEDYNLDVSVSLTVSVTQVD